MESISYLFIICFLGTVILAIHGAYKKLNKQPELVNDLVNFIFEEAEDLFTLLSEDFKEQNFDTLSEMFNGWMINLIKSSELPENLKVLATMENVSLLTRPMVEFLYNKKFGKSRLIELRKVTYSEEEELLLIQDEMRFLYENIVTKKNDKE